MELQESPGRIEIRRYWPAVRRNWWVVLLPIVALLAAALAYSASQTPLYESRSRVRAFNAALAGPNGNGRVDPVREIGIQVLYAQSDDVKAAVNERLGTDAKRVDSVAITSVLDADVIQFAVLAPTKSLAQKAAQDYADIFIEKRRGAVTTPLREQGRRLRATAAAAQEEIASLDRQIAEVEPKPTVDPSGRLFLPPAPEQVRVLTNQRDAAASRYDSSLTQADQLDIQAVSEENAINIVNPASRPSGPVVPATLRNAVIGLGLGLLIGLGLALMHERLDTRVRTVADVEQVAKTGFVVPIPTPRRKASRRVQSPFSDAAEMEGFRTLRAHLLFGNGVESPRSVLVTSADSPDDLTAAKLAMSLASAGGHVVLVDANLGSTRVSDALAGDHSADSTGLSDALVGDVDIDGVVRRVEVRGTGTLDLIASGRSTANRADLLIAQQASDVFARLRSGYEFLVINGPPLLGSADALPLARWVDGVVLTARAGKINTSDLDASLAELHAVSAAVVGIVLTGVKTHRPGTVAKDPVPSDANQRPNGGTRRERAALPPAPGPKG